MKIVALAGGVGGAKLAHGLAGCLPPQDLIVIVDPLMLSIHGYVTGTLARLSGRWKVRSLHWSSPVPPQH